MSYWGNTFMPTLDEMPLQVIKEMATFTDYTEEQLKRIWWRYTEDAGEEAEGDVIRYVDEICERLKLFIIVTLEKDW